ncbi:hypothetical protein BKA69DRAFT_1069060 [Paraphysoderma sedebokerense]|nr:hypothetical protein BKA69DRAFT_1069060 [Paraphysoderma sedebokerense]
MEPRLSALFVDVLIMKPLPSSYINYSRLYWISGCLSIRYTSDRFIFNSSQKCIFVLMVL